MHPLINFLKQVFSGPARAAQQPIQQTQPSPDITFNPNPNTNIPYSTHNAQYARQLAQPLYLGSASGAEGFNPQNTYGVGELDTNNYLQPSYHNPQTSLNGGLQQGNIQQPNYGADPFGWMNHPQIQSILRTYRGM